MKIINHEMDRTFLDLINEYGVEEVKMKLKAQQDSHLYILGITLDCGFNSEASFYRIFKKVTGVSSREFVKENAVSVEF
ncbi:MAG: helix-turn-helix domain-containing protein [Bacteroidota bacterium]